MDDDDVVGCCMECHSDQPDGYMTNSPFAQAGIAPPCRFCGGVVVVIYRADRENAIRQMDRERGL